MSAEGDETKVMAVLDALDKTDDPKDDPKLSFDFLLKWMNQRIKLLGYQYESKGPSDPNDKALVSFITEVQPMTFVIIKDNGEVHFQCTTVGQANMIQPGLCAYFLRQNITGKSTPLTQNNVDNEVQYGNLGGKGLSIVAFERVMKGLVEKQVEKNNELTGTQIH